MFSEVKKQDLASILRKLSFVDLPESVNWYPRSTQIFSLVDHLSRHFFVEMEYMDGENKSLDLNFRQKDDTRWGVI